MAASKRRRGRVRPRIVRSGRGVRRSYRGFRRRLAQLSGSPTRIAAGFAFGAAVSFTPLLAGQVALAALFAWICRANVPAAIIGTALGNPVTFPFIWAWIYFLGTFMLGREPVDLETAEVSFDYLMAHFMDIFVPMLVGSAPTAVAAWLAFFFPLRAAVANHRNGAR